MNNTNIDQELKNFWLTRKYAVYQCSTEEEYKILFNYLKEICGFRPISDANYVNYPVIEIIVQETPFDTLYSTLPNYTPALNDTINTYICETLDEFIEYTDYHNRIWK